MPAAGEELSAERGVLVLESAELGAQGSDVVGVPGLHGPDVVTEGGFDAGGLCRRRRAGLEGGARARGADLWAEGGVPGQARSTAASLAAAAARRAAIMAAVEGWPVTVLLG